MKNLENSLGFYQKSYQRPHEDNDPTKPQLYWDGYQWVARPFNSQVQPDHIKPGRKVLISNVPLELNLDIYLFKDYIISKMIEKNVISETEELQNNQNISDLITGIEFQKSTNSAVLIMSSIPLAKKMILLDGIILLDHTLRFSQYKEIKQNDVSLSNLKKESALANSAKISAKSAAISYAAFQSIINEEKNKKNSEKNGNKIYQKEVVLNINLDDKTSMISSRVVKVMGCVDKEEGESHLLWEVMDDIKEEFSKYGNIVSCKIIKKGKEKLGAEMGAIFVEFEDREGAENCIKGMRGRKYNDREISLAYISEKVYRNEIVDL